MLRKPEISAGLMGLPRLVTETAKSRGLSRGHLRRVGAWAELAKRLSRIIVLLFNTLMTKHNFLRLLEKNAGKTTIFRRNTKNYVYRRTFVE